MVNLFSSKIVIIVVIGILLSVLPLIEDEKVLLERYVQSRTEIENENDLGLSVMTFNIRFDGEEADPNNHFTKRIFRLKETIEKYSPALIGFQEPFVGQLLHLRTELPKRYNAVGYDKRGYKGFVNAILYDEEEFDLIDSDYIWLSETPNVENSKSWGGDERALCMAVFKWKKSNNQTVIMFNTHLDVHSELARRNQGKMIAEIHHTYLQRYPGSLFFLTGDFNSAPKQATHVILKNEMQDAWEECDSNAYCFHNDISSTFHFWKGSWANLYGVRWLQILLFTMHGSGLSLAKPKRMFEGQLFSPLEAIPSPNRMHVDWIMYKNQKETIDVYPKMVFVGDVRNHNCSSDHFPVIALFSVENSDKRRIICDG
eukprot:TRINITY_DN4280_c0_g1_i2.p1 TRINITY_DN4280_c0_g1~~TRINITY_DN4280_c0_g1_i2.p1  ORF type:complete len:371 (-),score=69.07 TRINITY_DN4280_c0_g1_i2:20-1132(-)